MDDPLPRIDSRRRRLLAYVHHNRDRMLVDAAVILAWVLGTWWLFGLLGVPRWMFYLVMFAGIILYTQATPPWQRPYRSPDLPG